MLRFRDILNSLITHAMAAHVNLIAKCYHHHLPNKRNRTFAMQVTIVNVSVKPEHVDDFIEASRLNHEASVNEPGNRRFDVLQSTDDPTKFVLYEAYENAAAAAKHKETAHYRKWRETVQDWMAHARSGLHYRGLYPA